MHLAHERDEGALHGRLVSVRVRARARARARARVKARARVRVRVRVTVRVRDKSHLLYAHALSLLGAELLVREALTLARRLQQRRREGGLLIRTGAQHTLARLPYLVRVRARVRARVSGQGQGQD